MLKFYTVAFFGHRDIEDIVRVESLLEKEIRRIIRENEYVDFLVGRHGDFDQSAASSVLRVRKSVGEHNSSLTLVLPYMTAEYRDNEEYFLDYYTDVEVSHKASTSHPKSAIQIRNREMVDRADLIICYIERKSGGAWQTVNYAIKQNKKVINLFEFEKE